MVNTIYLHSSGAVIEVWFSGPNGTLKNRIFHRPTPKSIHRLQQVINRMLGERKLLAGLSEIGHELVPVYCRTAE